MLTTSYKVVALMFDKLNKNESTLVEKKTTIVRIFLFHINLIFDLHLTSTICKVYLQKTKHTKAVINRRSKKSSYIQKLL